MNNAANDLFETLRDLIASTSSVMVESPESSPQGNLWSVWVDGEIIGAGDCRSEALADAVKTAQGWK